MTAGMKLLVGFALFMLLGWCGLYVGLSDHWPGGGGVERAQEKLLAPARQALQRPPFQDLQVTINGQNIRIQGVLGTSAQREHVRDLVLKSTGHGGWLMGGVSHVNVSGIKLMPPIANPNWSAKRDKNGDVLVTGYVANEVVRQKIIQKAKALFPGNVMDQMQLSFGAFLNGKTEQLAALESLSKLNTGQLVVQGGTFTLRGAAPSKVIADAVTVSVQAMSGAYQGMADVSYPPAPPNQFGISLYADPINDAAKCQALFAESLTKNHILFESGKAEINVKSHVFLNFLADLSKQCSSFSLQVDGHTDRMGPRAFNVQLSLRRAKAVAGYLLAKGVRADQITAKGYGPDKPLCLRKTSACRARNRRIEITVLK